MRKLKQTESAKMKIVFILLAIVSFTIACQEESNDSSDSTLRGKWTWVSSFGGIAGQTYTPQSTGEWRIIEFANDSIFRVYKRGTLFLETTYKTLSMEGYSEIFIEFKNYGMMQYVSFQDRNTLILNDYADDGFAHTYKR